MDGIFEWDNCLTENECDRLIEFFEENPELQSPGMVSSNTVVKEIKDTTDIYIVSDRSNYERATTQLIYKKCFEGIEQYIRNFQKLGLDRGDAFNPSVFSAQMEYGEFTYPQIQKVVKGGFFNWHSDMSPTQIRVLHFIFYLNDSNSYTGGKTEFCDGRIIEPKKGKLLIFPCSAQLIHRGNVVKEGVKYICSVFKQVYLRHKPA